MAIPVSRESVRQALRKYQDAVIAFDKGKIDKRKLDKFHNEWESQRQLAVKHKIKWQ